MIKKYLKKTFKKISYGFFLKIYGHINGTIENFDDDRIKVKKINLDNKLTYNIYEILNARLYTDRIHNTAAILDNKIIDGPSFQLRQDSDFSIYNSEVKNNIVLKIGTPRKLIKLNGTVLSLLTGGAGNDNYWHWMYDVMPRLYLCSKLLNWDQIDFFLLPSVKKQYQKETLDFLNIPRKKRISSEKFRHITANKIIITDHPVVTTGNATKDIQNIPVWITEWLKDVFVKNNNIKKENKVYIDRDDENTSTKPQRLISNNLEVKKYLMDQNFKSAKLHKISFKDQIELFSNANCIVGLHGSGFANIAFCKPRTKVIELKSTTAGNVIKNLAKKNNLDYASIDIAAKEIYKFNFPNQQGSIHVPLNKLEEILKN